MWLAGLGCLALAGGCQTMNARGASATGPSPSFGLSYAPAQAEPKLEPVATRDKAASRPATSPAAGDAEGDSMPAAANGRTRWLPGNDKEPGQRKALPVSSRTSAAADEDGLDL
jgi:hypothetical protein